MAKPYFQDLIPRNGTEPHARSKANIPIHKSGIEEYGSEEFRKEKEAEDAPSGFDSEIGHEPHEQRGIRTIDIPRHGLRGGALGPIDGGGRDGRGAHPSYARTPSVPPRRSKRSFVLWIFALIAVAAVVALFLSLMRSTYIVLVPRSQPVTLDAAGHIIAYPATSNMATGTLAYTVQTIDIDDSAPMPAGSSDGLPVTVSRDKPASDGARASGDVTIYNNYSDTSVRLVRNTRLQGKDGLVFRIPGDVVVPGKTAHTPGTITVTIIAEKPGVAYNTLPGKFTFPGLKSNGAMYSRVYAQSSVQFGTVVPSDEASSSGSANIPARAGIVSDVRARMEATIRAQAVTKAPRGSIVLPDLIQISYQDLPDSTDADGGHVHEHAHALAPYVSASSLAQVIAQPVVADAANADIRFVPDKSLSAHVILDESAASAGGGPEGPTLGVDPIMFSLSGSGEIVWNIDTQMLASALAGKDAAVFRTVVAGFPSIQDAHARIEPFWQSTFPIDPSKINIVISPAASGK